MKIHEDITIVLISFKSRNKIKTFALIEKKRETFYQHWTAHMGDNIKLIYRSNIVQIIEQIRRNIKFFKN